MTPTEELKKEHRAIEVMLQITDEVCKRLEAGQNIPDEHLGQIVGFFKGFADKCHHGKEEDILFKLIKEKKMPPFEGPMRVMLDEHNQGRSFIKAMSDAAMNYETDKQKYGPQFAQNAENYIKLLTQHIQKEDNAFFPTADKYLSENEQAKLAQEFDAMEEEKIGPGKHEEYHRLLETLRKIYLMKSV